MAGPLDLAYSVVVLLVAVAGLGYVTLGTEGVTEEGTEWQELLLASVVGLFVASMVVVTVA